MPSKQISLSAIVGLLSILTACEPEKTGPVVLPPVPPSEIDNNASNSQDRPRMALVIGNGAYLNDKLKNPVNDANAIAAALRELGFEVTLAENLDARGMDAVIKEFSKKLPEGGIAVFYYAGHGVQVEGENYLIPTDAELERQQEVQWETIALGKVIDSLEAANTTFNLFIIDACRDNPFYRKWRSANRGGAQEKGLTVQPPPDGTAIAFSTGPNDFAEDGQGNYSPYTASLLRHIKNKNEDVAVMLRKVRGEVKETTEGQQVPWFQESFSGEFSFNPSTDEEIVATQPIPTPIEPTPDPTRQAQPDASKTPIPQQSPRSPQQPEIRSQRVSFPSGADGVLLANGVEPGQIRRYMVNAQEGQIMTVQITGSSPGQATFDVLLPGGEMIADASGIVYWEGFLPVGGDYAIDVSADQQAEFNLEVRASTQVPSN